MRYVELQEGQRVRVDASRAHECFPKIGGQLSCAGVRYQRALWAILDATKHRPIITEIRDNQVEIATNYFGDGMLTLRVPRAAVTPLLKHGGTLSAT